MIKNWISAFRLKTLPLSFSCILVGNFLGFNSDYFSWTLLALALLTTLFLQILSNLANDLGDAMKGVGELHQHQTLHLVDFLVGLCF